MLYLPAVESVTMAHLKDIIYKKKIGILLDEVKPIVVPQYKGLTIENMLEFGGNTEDVVHALPIKKEVLKLEREYIANVIHTIVGEPFQ